MTEQRVALVTGGNRGLGFAICEALAKAEYAVALTARHQEKATEAVARLAAIPPPVHGFALDVSDTTSVREGVRAVYEKFGRIDVLVNNAAIYPDRDVPNLGLAVDPDMVLDTLNANTVGPYRVMQAVLPIMREQDYGRIVNVSSQMARLSAMSAGSPAYRMSKTALNALTTLTVAELGKTSNVHVNSVDPGWVRTDMGTDAADREISEGIDTIVWLATQGTDGPTGGFFRDRKPTNW